VTVVDEAGEQAWHSVSARLWLARRVEWAAVAVPVGVGATLAGWLPAGAVAGAPILAACVLAAGLCWRMLRRRCRSWRYAEREQDLLIARGVLFRRVTVVPYGRMQFVDVTAGPVERSFGLATVQLHTAAAATNARIPGLARAEAQRLRDQLAGLGEAQAAGL
jgi:membrane protein YdbS with pleckstrin-like domain